MADSGPTLAQLFDELWSDYQYFDTTYDSCSSNEYQEKARSSLKKSETAISMINELDLFSKNEDFDEIGTNEIRYLIVPALAGYFAYKLTCERLQRLEACKTHLTNFIKVCSCYGLTDLPSENKASEPGSQQEIIDMAHQRQAKIQKFKKQKERDQKLKDLYEKVKQEHVDDEIKRDYYINLVEKFIDTSLEDLEAVEREIPLVGMTSCPQKPVSTQERKGPAQTPFILTRDNVQKQVFGMGYTNLPTYSVEEFYERQAAAGLVPEPTGPEKSAEEEEEEQERKEEQDDKETLEKKRWWDDWKDDHRRGWGNRQNMG